MERSFLHVTGALAQGAAAAQVGFAGASGDLKNGGRGQLTQLAAVIVMGIAAQFGIEEFCKLTRLDAAVKKKNVARGSFERGSEHGKAGTAGVLGFEFEQDAVHKGSAELFAADVADVAFPAEEFEDGTLFEEAGDSDSIAETVAPQAATCGEEN